LIYGASFRRLKPAATSLAVFAVEPYIESGMPSQVEKERLRGILPNCKPEKALNYQLKGR